MRAIALFIVCLTSLLAHESHAQENNCAPLLQDGIRNTLYEKYDRSFIEEFHSAMCSEEQSQLDEAKARGVELGYGDFIANFSGSNKKIAGYQSAMCSADSDISRGSTFYEVTRNHVSSGLAESYVKCQEIQSGGIVYRVFHGDDSDSVSVEIGYDGRLRAGSGSLEISKLVISPERFSDKVSCEGPLADKLANGSVNVTTFNGYQTLTCRPKGDELQSGDNDFSVFVHTTLGIIEGHVKPFHAGKNDRLDVLENDVADSFASINELIGSVKTDLSGTTQLLGTDPTGEISGGAQGTQGGANAQLYSSVCPSGLVAVGVRVSLGGTCGTRCDPDGRPVHYFETVCRKRLNR